MERKERKGRLDMKERCNRFDICGNAGKYIFCKSHNKYSCESFDWNKEQEAANALAYTLAETYWKARLEVIPDYKDTELMDELVKTAVEHQWQRFVHKAIRILEEIKEVGI